MGEQGLSLLTTQYKQLETLLGRDFFDCFKETLLANCCSFESHIKPIVFKVFQDMMEQLGGTENRIKLLLWQSVLRKHTQSVGFDLLEKLWRGFCYFYENLTDFNLRLSGEELQRINPGNMFVIMDRVLSVLRNLPEKAKLWADACLAMATLNQP